MPALLLAYYETVSNWSKNVEKHTPALFMMHHNNTMTISLKLGVCQTFFSNIFVYHFQG